MRSTLDNKWTKNKLDEGKTARKQHEDKRKEQLKRLFKDLQGQIKKRFTYADDDGGDGTLLLFLFNQHFELMCFAA